MDELRKEKWSGYYTQRGHWHHSSMCATL